LPVPPADRRRALNVGDPAVFHHEAHVTNCLDVGERIARDGDDVDELAARKGTTFVDPIRPAACTVALCNASNGFMTHSTYASSDATGFRTPFNALGSFQS
jgi:hypothetical protein